MGSVAEPLNLGRAQQPGVDQLSWVRMFWGFFHHLLPLLSHLPTQAVARDTAKAHTTTMKTKDIAGLLRPSRATDTVEASLVAGKFQGVLCGTLEAWLEPQKQPIEGAECIG